MHTPCDVLIVGGGLAGSCLARQLRRQSPDLHVRVIEKNTETSFKVGESTVEIATQYLVRRLGLSTYLYDQQLPKNGLRFFFDDVDKSTSLTEMSELGSDALPLWPAFQLDRARFESDLRAMNIADGVEYWQGHVAVAIELGTADDPPAQRHRVEVRDPDGHISQVHARWLVDASGRASMVAKARGLRTAVPDLQISAAWGRFGDVVDLDDIEAEPSWRGRVRHTSRVLSTNHFCHRGYWIWLIPLGRGVTSVGVVGQPEHFDAGMRKPRGLMDFLARHRAVGELMAGAENLDAQMFGRLAYGTRQFFSADGWFLIGDAAAFADPFYSPGSDFIALENDLVADSIAREARGDGHSLVRERVAAYEQLIQHRFRATLTIYHSLYEILGSYELYRAKWFYDIANYYNLWAWSYMLDDHFDARWLTTQNRRAELTLQASDNFSRLFCWAGAQLVEQDAYYRQNRGRFHAGLSDVDFVARVGTKRSRRDSAVVTDSIFNETRRRLLSAVDPNTSVDSLGLADFVASAGIIPEQGRAL